MHSVWLLLVVGVYASNTLNVATVKSGAIVATSLNVGSGTIQTTGSVSGGTLTASSGLTSTGGTTTLGTTTTTGLTASGLITASAGLTSTAGTTALGTTTVTSLSNSGSTTVTGSVTAAAFTTASGTVTASKARLLGTLDSTAQGLGALEVAGGASVNKTLRVGGDMVVGGTATVANLLVTNPNTFNSVAGYLVVNGGNPDTPSSPYSVNPLDPPLSVQLSGAIWADGGNVGTDGIGNIQFDPISNRGYVPRAILWGGGGWAKGFVDVQVSAEQIRSMTGTAGTDVLVVPFPTRFANSFSALMFVETAFLYPSNAGSGQPFTTGDSSTPGMALFLSCGGTRQALTSATDWPWTTWNNPATPKLAPTRGLTGPSNALDPAVSPDCGVYIGPTPFSSTISGGFAGSLTPGVRLSIWYGWVGVTAVGTF